MYVFDYSNTELIVAPNFMAVSVFAISERLLEFFFAYQPSYHELSQSGFIGFKQPVILIWD